MLKVEVVGKNGFTPSKANEDYAAKKLAKLENFLDTSDDIIARVVLKVYPKYHKVEITVNAKEAILRAEVQEVDVYAAIDKAIDKLLGQVRKYKTKFKNKMAKEAVKEVAAKLEEENTLERKLTRQKSIDLEPMSKEEAIDQMELLGHDFFIYLDKQTHKTNVIYLRDDGDYAVIETNNK